MNSKNTKIKNTSFMGFYYLNVDEGINIKDDQPDKLTDDYKEWLEKAKLKVSNKKGRNFKFNSDKTEVYSCIKDFICTSDEVCITKITDRLFRTLADAKKKYDHLQEITKNNFFISVTKKEDNEFECFLALFHNEDYLNKASYKKDEGLPFNETTFKASIILLNENFELLNMYTSDSNPTIAKYWSESFLDSIELLDDTKNSNNAFDSIEKYFKEKVYNVSKRDFYELRNETVAYFRMRESFDYSDFKTTVFNKFTPESDKIIKEELTRDIDIFRNNLHENMKFDDAFTIDKKSLKKRFNKQIFLHGKIELLLKEDVENLRDIIKSIEHENQKGIFIKSVDGYNEFST